MPKPVRQLDLDSSLSPASRRIARNFLRDRRAQNHSALTIRSHEDTLCRLGQHCGGDVVDATREQLQDWLIAMYAEGLADATVASYYRRAHAFYAWLVEDDILDDSPMRKIKKPKEESKAPEVFTADQMAAMLATTITPAAVRKDKRNARRVMDDARDRAILLLLCQPGTPRASEMLLSIADVDIDSDDACALIHGKGGQVRTIGLDDECASALSKYLRLRERYPAARKEDARYAAEKAAQGAAQAEGQHAPEPAAPALWLGKYGPMTYSGIEYVVRQRGDAAGIAGAHPHRFRHSTYDMADGAGVSARTLEQLYGWQKGSKMTSMYGRDAAGRRAVTTGRGLNFGGKLAGK